jgi:hypothetical protein
MTDLNHYLTEKRVAVQHTQASPAAAKATNALAA